MRATTSQRCVRAGGKHNDLENVGYTARHHTFFEMLGNFTFGDYFKRDAIRFAWELLTKVYKLPPERLWATVYQTDDEAYDIWTKEIGVPAERVRAHRRQAGRPEVPVRQLLADGRHRPLRPVQRDLLRPRPRRRGRPARIARRGRRPLHRDLEPRVHAVQPRREGRRCNPLPKPSVDTGMGLERIAAVLQHVHSNYEIDLFQDLIKAAARETGTKDLEEPFAQRHRRPHPRLLVPDRRRRDPGQRGPRLRAAPDHPPRDPPRLQARPEAAVLPQAGRRPRPGDGRRLSRSCARRRNASPRC